MYILDTVESVVPVDNTVTGVSYTYLTIKKNTGRITHHFLVDASYRFDLRKKKSSGKWYFYCSVPGCTASLKAIALSYPTNHIINYFCKAFAEDVRRGGGRLSSTTSGARKRKPALSFLL